MNIMDLFAGSLVKNVGEVMDNLFTSDEEELALKLEIAKASQNYDVEMKKLNIKEEEIYLVDTQSARDMNTKVQESENASWLGKNIMPVLAVVTTALTFIFFYLVIFGTIEESKENMIMFILGALTTIVTQIYGYFFGSSKSSSDKTKMLTASYKG